MFSAANLSSKFNGHQNSLPAEMNNASQNVACGQNGDAGIVDLRNSPQATSRAQRGGSSSTARGVRRQRQTDQNKLHLPPLSDESSPSRLPPCQQLTSQPSNVAQCLEQYNVLKKAMAATKPDWMQQCFRQMIYEVSPLKSDSKYTEVFDQSRNDVLSLLKNSSLINDDGMATLNALRDFQPAQDAAPGATALWVCSTIMTVTCEGRHCESIDVFRGALQEHMKNIRNLNSLNDKLCNLLARLDAATEGLQGIYNAIGGVANKPESFVLAVEKALTALPHAVRDLFRRHLGELTADRDINNMIARISDAIDQKKSKSARRRSSNVTTLPTTSKGHSISPDGRQTSLPSIMEEPENK